MGKATIMTRQLPRVFLLSMKLRKKKMFRESGKKTPKNNSQEKPFLSTCLVPLKQNQTSRHVSDFKRKISFKVPEKNKEMFEFELLFLVWLFW